jgi:hypothetical protein
MWYVIVAIVVGFAAMWLWSMRRHRRFRVARAGLTFDSFQLEFEGTPYSRAAMAAAYSDLTELCGFPSTRHDNLRRLGVLPEDFEDMLEKRLNRLGMMDDIHASKYAGLLPIWTSEDYVRLLDEIMKGEPSNVLVDRH